MAGGFQQQRFQPRGGPVLPAGGLGRPLLCPHPGRDQSGDGNVPGDELRLSFLRHELGLADDVHLLPVVPADPFSHRGRAMLQPARCRAAVLLLPPRPPALRPVGPAAAGPARHRPRLSVSGGGPVLGLSRKPAHHLVLLHPVRRGRRRAVGQPTAPLLRRHLGGRAHRGGQGRLLRTSRAERVPGGAGEQGRELGQLVGPSKRRPQRRHHGHRPHRPAQALRADCHARRAGDGAGPRPAARHDVQPLRQPALEPLAPADGSPGQCDWRRHHLAGRAPDCHQRGSPVFVRLTRTGGAVPATRHNLG